MLEMRELPIQVTLTVHLVLSIDPTEQYPLAAIAEVITQQGIESTLLEKLVQSLNEYLVEAYCGDKYTHGNGTKRFQRSATSTRSAITTATADRDQQSSTQERPTKYSVSGGRYDSLGPLDNQFVVAELVKLGSDFSEGHSQQSYRKDEEDYRGK